MSQLRTTSSHRPPHPEQTMLTALLALGDAPVEAPPHTGPCSYGATTFRNWELMLFFIFSPTVSFFFLS